MYLPLALVNKMYARNTFTLPQMVDANKKNVKRTMKSKLQADAKDTTAQSTST